MYGSNQVVLQIDKLSLCLPTSHGLQLWVLLAFESRFHTVAQNGLEHTMYLRLASNS